MNKTWQQDWIREPAQAIEQNQQIVEVDNWRGSLGGRRLKSSGALLGEARAVKFAKELGAYELDFQLTFKVQAQGAELSATGEFPILSPNRWAPTSDTTRVALNWQQKWKNEGISLVAFVLSKEEKARFLAFLNKMNATVTSIWDLWELAEHYFLGEKDKLKVITETRQRV